MVSDLVSGVLWSEPCRRWVSELKRRSCESEDLEWFWMKEWSLISCQVFSDLNPVEDEWVNWEKKLWIWRSGVILDEGMVSDLLSGVLWSEPCRRRVSELKRRSCESEDLEWFWMKEWSLISCQVFSDLNPVEDEWGELKRRSCESEDLEWFWMKEWSLISCQVFSDLNPVEDEWVNWREKLWIWRSGVILDEGMVSDLVSGVLWSEPCRRWVRWTEEEKLWIWRSGVILDEGMVSDLVSGVLWSEPCRRWVSELKRRSCESRVWSDSGWRNGLWSRVRCSLTWTL